jgi:hypothetical protein
MFSSIFVIVCVLFEWNQICAGFLSYILYMYCLWRFSYREMRVWISSTGDIVKSLNGNCKLGDH